MIIFRFLVFQNFIKICYEIPADLNPRNFYQCPCVTHLINEIYDVDIREYFPILKAVLYCRMIPKQVLSTRVENKTSSF